MIIGKNNPIKKSFHNNFSSTPTINMKTNNPINPMKNSNPLDKEGMKEKSFEMLQDRLNKGLISLDEFNKKCKQIGKLK